ncbi:MAG: flagellar basal-body rod modification protein FlgD [Myxococcota bacterium]|jgi:flagellar basal-body rod modification protein FlgD
MVREAEPTEREMDIAIDGVTQFSQTSSAPMAQEADLMGQDTFLQLLTTQLQNQDPLNPQSNEEFVAQLAQFSSLEQLVGLNDSVDNLYLATASMNNASMTQLLGREVVAWSDEFHYDGEGSVEIGYEASADVSSAEITITDEDGSVVWSGPMGSLDEGEGSYSWDGTDQSGNTVGEGVYSFSITGQDSNGDDIEVVGQLAGEIDGMSYASGAPVPSISGVEIGLSDIIRVETVGEEDEDGLNFEMKEIERDDSAE